MKTLTRIIKAIFAGELLSQNKTVYVRNFSEALKAKQRVRNAARQGQRKGIAKAIGKS